MMRKLKLFAPIFLIMLSVVGFITFFFTWVNIGFSQNFIAEWLPSLLIGLCIFSPLGFIVTLLINKIVSLFMKKENSLTKKIVIGVLIGCTMEFIISLITVIINFGFTSSIISQWFGAFAKAVPIGIMLGLLVSFLIKPWISNRIEKFKLDTQKTQS